MRVKKYNSTKSIPTTSNAPSHQVKILNCCRNKNPIIKSAVRIPCLKLTPRNDNAHSSLSVAILRIEVKKRIAIPAKKRNALIKKSTCPTKPDFSGSMLKITMIQVANAISALIFIPHKYDFRVIFFTLLNCLLRQF